MSTIRGKALLQVERLDSEWVKYAINPILLSGHKEDNDDECVRENFDCAESQSVAVPSALLKMKPGDRLTVAVTYCMRYKKDYWGEWDVEVTYPRERVLKRRPYKEKRSDMRL